MNKPKYQPSLVHSKLSNRWFFVGSCPAGLIYVDMAGRPAEHGYCVEQMYLPSAYRSIRGRTFNTPDEAIQIAKEEFGLTDIYVSKGE